jgi:hypothetical protein
MKHFYLFNSRIQHLYVTNKYFKGKMLKISTEMNETECIYEENKLMVVLRVIILNLLTIQSNYLSTSWTILIGA